MREYFIDVKDYENKISELLTRSEDYTLVPEFQQSIQETQGRSI